MIYAKYSEKDKKLSFYASGDNFEDIVEVSKIHNGVYSKKTKKNIMSPYDGYRFLKQITFENISEIQISDYDFLSLKKDKEIFAPIETRNLKIELIKDYFDRYPPIKGKSPNEDFQLECIEKGLSQNRLALFLGMGSGKTFVTIQILNHLIDNNKIDRVCIVAPPQGVVNWKRELLKFSSHFTIDDIVISKAKENRDPLINDPKVIIMTYRHYLTLSDDYYKKNNKNKHAKKYRKDQIPFGSWGSNRAIVLDESHLVKNHKARQSYVIDLHKKYFDYRYLLTGTPTPNNFGEIYSQIKFLDASSVPLNYNGWIKEIATIGTLYSEYEADEYIPEKVEKWEKRLSPWVVRYRSDDILDLPSLYVNKIYIDMSSKQRDIYKKLIAHVLWIIKDENGRIEPRKVTDKFPYISMALENPLLLKGKVKDSELATLIDAFDFEKDHNKFEITKSLLNKYINEEHRKVVIFDYHPLTMDLLNKSFSKYNPILIHGQNTPAGLDTMEFRSDMIDEFKNSDSRKLLIGSSKVLATAINLQEATRAIYFCRDYSYLSWSQSQKRLHRIGQANEVVVNPLIYEYTIDERLDDALSEKHNLDMNIFKRASLSKEEWQKVFLGEM